jgi:hypothetical protein
METKVDIQDHGCGRKKVSITIELSKEEMHELERKKCQRHVDSDLPIPCQFFQNEDPEVRIAQGVPIWNGNPYKSYFLKSARRVLMNRPTPGKTHLRIPVPGKFELGYINSQEEDKFIKWWQQTKVSIANQLKEKLFSVSPTQAQFTPSAPRTVDETKVELNPLNPNEKGGLRKRCLDII